MWKPGLDEAQAGIKIARGNINNPRYADDTTLMAESKEELKSLLMKVKKGSEKLNAKTQHLENKDHAIWSHSVRFSSFQSLSRVRLFVTPWITAHQASLSITNPGAYSNSCPSSRW